MQLIHAFIENINPDTDVDAEWKKFVDIQRRENLDAIIDEEKLKHDETYHFVSNAFRNGILKTTGTDIDVILPPVSRFGGGNRAEKKENIITNIIYKPILMKRIIVFSIYERRIYYGKQ